MVACSKGTKAADCRHHPLGSASKPAAAISARKSKTSIVGTGAAGHTGSNFKLGFGLIQTAESSSGGTCSND